MLAALEDKISNLVVR